MPNFGTIDDTTGAGGDLSSSLLDQIASLSVDTVADLPSSSTDGDVKYVKDTQVYYIYNAAQNEWESLGTNLTEANLKFLRKDENLNDIPDKALARQNLGIAAPVDAYTKTETDMLLDDKANVADVYSKADADTLLANKVDKVSGKDLSTNDFTNSYKSQVDANTTNRHTHTNKVLLDSYDQSNSDITDAVNKKHSHSNKTVLDGTQESFTSALKATYDNYATDIATASPTQLNSVQRFVSFNAGNDSNNGQINRKMKNIFAGALTSLIGQSSAEVDCEAGTYTEAMTLGTAHSRRTIRGTRGSERTIINQTLTFSENNQQCSIMDIKFDNATGYCIDVNSTLSNYNFLGLNIGGNVSNSTAIRVRAGGSGFIKIQDGDFAGKIIQLDNTSTPRMCYLINCANAIINAGTGWTVLKNLNCATIIEASSNNNIYDGWIANSVISSDAEYNAVVAAGLLGNGYYLCNYTKAGVFSVGDVILRNHPITVIDHKHYNANTTFYVAILSKTFFRKGGQWKEVPSIDELNAITGALVASSSQDLSLTSPRHILFQGLSAGANCRFPDLVVGSSCRFVVENDTAYPITITSLKSGVLVKGVSSFTLDAHSAETFIFNTNWI
jgi:hypothetical protein